MNSWERRVDSARGALLGTFVGDALGMPFEGLPTEAIPRRVELEEARLGRGTYTDDTQMMIALAESLVECGGIDEEHLARAFQDAYDPLRGYGPGTRRVLELWAAGTPIAAAARQIWGGQGSRGNGAAMRIAPVAVRFGDDPRRLGAEAARSARLTHAHPIGIDAAVVQAAGIAGALRGEDILGAAFEAAGSDEMREGLREVATLLDGDAEQGEVRARLGSSPDARESVCAAIYSAVGGGVFEQAVCFAVRLGGDTDTIAGMTGAIAGGRDGARSIPGRWLEALEEGERGRSHVEELAGRLIAPER